MTGRTDREAIGALKFEYQRALDADETDALLAVFTDDATIYHDGADSALEGVAEYRQWVEDVTAGRLRSTHVAMNPILAVEGDEATGRWRYIDLIDRGESVTVGQGYYEDEYRRTATGWRIAATTIYRDYSIDLDPDAVRRDWSPEFFESRPYLDRA